MVDHIRALLLNSSETPGYVPVADAPADTAMRLFGLSGDCNDAARVDALLPLALSDDLSEFRKPFDTRLSPKADDESVYRHAYTSCGACSTCTSLSLDGVYDDVLGTEGRWQISPLFTSDDPVVSQVLSSLRAAADSCDSTFALGAVLIACAYRRFVKRGES